MLPERANRRTPAALRSRGLDARAIGRQCAQRGLDRTPGTELSRRPRAARYPFQESFAYLRHQPPA